MDIIGRGSPLVGVEGVNSQDLIVNSTLFLLQTSFEISSENLVLDLGNNLYLLGLSLLNICSLENVWIEEGVTWIYFTWFSTLFFVDDYSSTLEIA